MRPLLAGAIVVLAAAAILTPVAAQGAAVAPRAATAGPPTPGECLALTGGRCLDPAGMRAAYNLGGLYAQGITGKGVSVGIVDSFGSPTIRADIAIYSKQYGLPPVNLQIATPAGTPPAFRPGDSDMAGWAIETTLDVEVVHSIAPDAKIVLIETPVSETEGLQGFPEIIKAENAMLDAHKVDVLSQSFAATEATFDSPAQIRGLSAQIYPRAQHDGVTVLSSSGDNGPTDLKLDQKTLYTRAVTDWPASDPLVTAVGGTMLTIGADGRRAASDAAWGGAGASGAGGGGRSTVFPRPAFQTSVADRVGEHRGVPDISLDAAPSSGLIIYGSFPGADGWSIGGGTSQAAPILAGIVALADQQASGRVGYLNDVLYQLAANNNPAVVDVTRGTNALARQQAVPGYAAGAGYDLATGVGTVDGGLLVPALVAATKGKTVPLAAAGGVAAPTSPGAPTSASTPAPSPRPQTLTARTVSHDSGPPTGVVVAAIVLVAVVAGGAGAVAVLRRRRSSARG